MTALDRINLFISLFVDTLRNFDRWRAWILLLAYFAINCIVLSIHREFLSPYLYAMVSMWTSLVSEARAPFFAHYPQHFILLGDYYSWAKLIVGGIAEGIILGAVARSFGEVYLGSPDKPWKPRTGLLERYLHFVVVWLVLNLVTVAVGQIVPEILSPYINGPRRALAVSIVLMPACFTAIFSLFLFAIPMVAVREFNAFQAIGRSILMSLRHPFMCFFLASAILAGPLFFAVMTSQPNIVVDKFRPELLYWLLVAGLAAEVVANYFWMGTTVRYLVQPDE